MKNDILEPSPPPQEDHSPAPATAESEPLKSAPLTTDWQQSSQPVFVVEDSFYRSRTPPRPVHWSIAWSDLMMTMFILFLVLFAHLRNHEEIRAHGKPNKIADETIAVQAKDAPSALVFHPISQEVSLKTSDKLQEALLPRRESTGADVLIRHKAVEDKASQERIAPIPEATRAQQTAPPAPPAAAPPPTLTAPPVMSEQPPPSTPEQTAREELITKIYDLSKITVEKEKLERFASVELVPDKTMRIILTGDLLFTSGQAELSPNAAGSLKKLSSIINKTPYMINVIGHTDDRPVRSARFPSNWELSLARAGRVARFLIEDTKLPPTQFSVTGYSSFKPVKPNTSEENRKINRRVEIILSKELPQAEAAPPVNLH